MSFDPAAPQPPAQQAAPPAQGAEQTLTPPAEQAAAPTPSVPELVPGVPFFALDNPFGGTGIGVLVGYDPEASHEVGQPKESPATDQAPPIAWVPSGGSAYYMDFTTGKGWSVPLNPQGV